jgi:hypothetical protein
MDKDQAVGERPGAAERPQESGAAAPPLAIPLAFGQRNLPASSARARGQDVAAAEDGRRPPSAAG